MNIAFVANFEKTNLFESIIKYFDDTTHVFWFVPNPEQSKRLRESYGNEKVIPIDRSTVLSKTKTKRLSGIERFEIPIVEFVMTDRVQRKKPWKSFVYLAMLHNQIINSIIALDIQLVFGELTWAYELTIREACRNVTSLESGRRVRYLNPHTTRIPRNRFAFFTDGRQSIMTAPVNHQVSIRLEEQKPDYLELNDRRIKNRNSPSGLIRSLRTVIRRRSYKDDPAVERTLYIYILARLKEIKNSFYYKIFVNTKRFYQIPNGKYVVYPLHLQPEASIDVFGRYAEDQIKNVFDLVRSVPYGTKVLVKEHSNAIGQRPIRFYRELKAIPNVIVIDHRVSMARLITIAERIISVTGTAAMEASLRNNSGATLVPTYFSHPQFCPVLECMRTSLLEKKCNATTRLVKHNQNKEYKAYLTDLLQKFSFIGKVSDGITDPSVMREENLERVGAAFNEIITSESSNSNVDSNKTIFN